MSNKPIKVNSETAHEICSEIQQKISNYESRMMTRLSRWVEVSSLYCGKSFTSGDNKKPSANSSELFKAIRAMRCMIMRMLLGNKPAFELECMDIIGYDDPAKLIKAEHYVAMQMESARFEKGLAKALDQLLLYGTAVVHNQYEPLRAPFLGRRQYATTYKPIPLINCAFGLDSNDVEDSSWIAISDIQSKRELSKLLKYDSAGAIYNHSEIKKAQAQTDYSPKMNMWMEQRMYSQGYTDGLKDGIERQVYYGPLDCMDSAEEYCVEVVNRQFIVRLETYEGLKPVRVATINNIDDPLGNGLGDLFRPLLKKIDDSESALLNMIMLAGANMFSKQKSLTDEDSEFMISQFRILNLENPMLNPIGPNPVNMQAVAQYLESKVQGFRQASGATDILQAVVDNNQATATASSLAMNEAVRALSVQAQLLAPVLVADHVRMVLQNAQKYNTEAQVVHIKGMPVTVVPSDLLIDVNVRIKTVTDQDFRPAKLQRLGEAIKMMAMFPPNAIPGKKMNPGPAIMEYLKTLDTPRWNESVQDITEEDMLMSRMAAEMGQAPQQAQVTGDVEAPPLEEGTIKTPVGEVMAAPSDAANTNQVVRQSSVQ